MPVRPCAVLVFAMALPFFWFASAHGATRGPEHSKSGTSKPGDSKPEKSRSFWQQKDPQLIKEIVRLLEKYGAKEFSIKDGTKRIYTGLYDGEGASLIVQREHGETSSHPLNTSKQDSIDPDRLMRAMADFLQKHELTIFSVGDFVSVGEFEARDGEGNIVVSRRAYDKPLRTMVWNKAGGEEGLQFSFQSPKDTVVFGDPNVTITERYEQDTSSYQQNTSSLEDLVRFLTNSTQPNGKRRLYSKTYKNKLTGEESHFYLTGKVIAKYADGRIEEVTGNPNQIRTDEALKRKMDQAISQLAAGTSLEAVVRSFPPDEVERYEALVRHAKEDLSMLAIAKKDVVSARVLDDLYKRNPGLGVPLAIEGPKPERPYISPAVFMSQPSGLERYLKSIGYSLVWNGDELHAFSPSSDGNKQHIAVNYNEDLSVSQIDIEEKVPSTRTARTLTIIPGQLVANAVTKQVPFKEVREHPEVTELPPEMRAKVGGPWMSASDFLRYAETHESGLIQKLQVNFTVDPEKVDPETALRDRTAHQKLPGGKQIVTWAYDPDGVLSTFSSRTETNEGNSHQQLDYVRGQGATVSVKNYLEFPLGTDPRETTPSP